MRYFLTILLFCVHFTLWPQRAEIELEPSKILIGEHAMITFTISFPAGSELQMPVFNEKIHDKIEILNYGSNDTIRRGTDPSTTQIRRTLRVTSWDEGFHAIAPFEFLIINNQDTLLIETEPVLFEVEPFSIEEHTDLKDIKSIFSAPITFAEIKFYLLGLIVLAVFIWLLIRYLKNRKKKPEPQSVWEKPDVPAHIAAISSLEHLKSQKLWQQGRFKEYHSKLTDIIRHYIEKRYKIGAMELTSSEILAFMPGKDKADTVMVELESMLLLADLVKFAKYQPEATENENSMQMAFRFVNQTRLDPASEPADKEEPSADNLNN